MGAVAQYYYHIVGIFAPYKDFFLYALNILCASIITIILIFLSYAFILTKRNEIKKQNLEVLKEIEIMGWKIRR